MFYNYHCTGVFWKYRKSKDLLVGLSHFHDISTRCSNRSHDVSRLRQIIAFQKPKLRVPKLEDAFSG